MIKYRKYIFALSALLFLVTAANIRGPQTASAHPLGNFTINRYSRLEPQTDRLYIQYVLDMAEIPTFQEMSNIDLNGDGWVSN